MRKPAMTEAVLSALSTCIVHAEMVVQTDADECFVGDSARVERASKWHREMVAWMRSRKGEADGHDS